MQNALSWLVAGILGIGLLPSFTALSWQLTKDFPSLSQYMGPINVLKIYSPVLLFYIWTERKRIPEFLRLVTLIGLGVCALGTLLAVIPCGFPNTELREFAILVLGSVSALSFLLLPKTQTLSVLGAWAFFVYGSALLDFLAPDAITWLYNNIFDPSTPITDYEQTQRKVLAGVFSRQSMAKLLSWLPWLLLIFAFRYKFSSRVCFALGILCILSSGATLATTQRGPFLASIAAWVLFSAHQSIRLKDHGVAMVAGSALVLSLLTTFAVVPNDLIVQRFQFLQKSLYEKKEMKNVDGSIEFRRRVTRIATKQVLQNPLGNACIPVEEYRRELIWPAHSHNLYLQQFLSRGWIWGFLHLFLWGLAWYGAWRSKTNYGSALTAGLTAVMVGGLVDHPWFPLNHAMLLATFLFLGLQFWKIGGKKKKRLEFVEVRN